MSLRSRFVSRPSARGGLERHLEDELSRTRHRLDRERAARKEAEQISESAIRRLYDKQAELELLQIVATASNEASDVDEAMRVAVSQVCAHTGWPVGHVYRFDKDPASELVPTTIWHLEDPSRFETFRRETEATCFLSGVGLPGRVLANGTPAWIIDVTDDPNFPRAKAAAQVGLKAAFAFPVLVSQEVVAVLEFFAPGAAEPDEALLVLMANIGTQLGRVVERERAQEQHEGFQGILDNAPATIFARDLDGRFLFVNRQFERRFHVKAEQAAGKTVYDFLPAEAADALMASDRKVLEEGGPLEFEHVIPHRDGSRSYLSVKFPLRDAAGAPYAVCGISVDVTERKRIEAELGQKEEVERANKAKTAFLSRVSHELRTPLNAILGFAQLLEIDELQSRQHDSVDQILRAGRHLLELINEVLEISRIEAGNLAISLEPVEVRVVIAEVLELVKPLAAKRHVRLEGPPSEAGAYFVDADKQRLKQVLLNLLSNAVKYNREGGSVIVTVEQGPLERLRLLVSDTGQGIPEEKLAELFTPFERLGAERTSIEGTGLGLALSKLLVEAMGGTLGVESKRGVGTTFAVELALAEAPLHAHDRAEVERLAPRPSGAEGMHTVLHVEDNLSNFKLVEQILANRPEIELLAATEGGLGLELAREHHPDLVLLDLHLPGMPGQEVLKLLKEDQDTRVIPVVVVSADATQSRIERVLASGAHAYLTKPLDVGRFLAIVDEALSTAAFDNY